MGQAKSSQLTEMRTILEPEITMLATSRATPADLDAIETVVIAQEKELQAGELSRKLDMEFHCRVTEAAHNPVLNIVVNAVNESIRDAILRSMVTKEIYSHVVTFHRDIFEAVRNHDDGFARSVMTEHVLDVQCHIESAHPERP
jgi:GntR family transcriptional repressor for pyruvate dehydrogenase complex